MKKNVTLLVMVVCLMSGEAFASNCAELARRIWRLSSEISDGITAFNRREAVQRIALEAKRNELAKAFAAVCQAKESLQKDEGYFKACAEYKQTAGELSRMESETLCRENEHVGELVGEMERLEKAFEALNERMVQETDIELAWEAVGGQGFQYQVRSCIGLLKNQMDAVAGHVSLDAELEAIVKCVDAFSSQMDGASAHGMLRRQSTALKELVVLLNQVSVTLDATIDGKELVGTAGMADGDGEEATSTL